MSDIASTLPMETRRRNILTLANKITIARILLIPLIVIGLLEHQWKYVLPLLIFSMVSDFLDGLAARKRGERTRLGAFLDPMADKLLLTAMFMALTYLNRMDTWMFVVIFSRDLLIVLGWAVIFILTGSSAVHPRVLGKATTAVQMCATLFCMLSELAAFKHIFLLFTITVTIASAIDYILVGEKRLGDWA